MAEQPHFAVEKWAGDGHVATPSSIFKLWGTGFWSGLGGSCQSAMPQGRVQRLLASTRFSRAPV